MCCFVVLPIDLPADYSLSFYANCACNGQIHANVLLLLVPAPSLDSLRPLMRNTRRAAEDDANQHQLEEEECQFIDSWGGINWCERCLWRLGQAPEHHCAWEVAREVLVRRQAGPWPSPRG